MITDPAVLRRRGPGRHPDGARQGRLLRARPAVPAADGAGRLAGAVGRHHAADPDRAGRGHRLGLRHSWDRATSRSWCRAPPSGSCSGYLLAAYVSDAAVTLAVGIISVAFAVRRLVLERRGRRRAAGAGRRAARRLLGHDHRLHQHDRPCRRTAVPDLRHAAAPRPRRLRRDGGHPVRAHQLDQGAALHRARPVHAREPRRPSAVLFPLAILPTWAGVWLVRRVPGERFYTIVYALLVLVGLKLMLDGASGARRESRLRRGGRAE